MKDLILPAVKHLTIGDEGVGAFELPSVAKVREVYWNLIKESKSGYFKVKIGNPYKPRTTGHRSQCNRINGHLQWICMVKGSEFDDLKLHLKRRAFRRGFPMLRDNLGGIVYSMNDREPLPISEADASVEEARVLSEEIEQFAAEEGIPLPEYTEEGDLIYI